MEEELGHCGCSCICDPTVARVLDQTSSRFNDRSAFANNNQMDLTQQMNALMVAKAQQTLTADSMMNMLMGLLAQQAVAK